MLNIRKINPMVRAIGTMGAVAALAGAVTFSALTTNTVALTGNEMDVTTDVLRISNGGGFATSVSGFSNPNMVVGNEGTKNAFYFQNLANAGLILSASIPSGTFASNNIDTTKVHLKIYDKDGTTLLLDKTLNELITTAQALGGQLDANAQGNGGIPGTEGNYFYSLTVDAAAVTGNPSNVTSFDLDFSGTT